MEQQVNLSEFDIKVEKIKRLEEQGEKSYKAKFNKTHEIHDLDNIELGTKVSVAGRMIFKRTFGKLIFARLYAIGDNFDCDLTQDFRTSVQISLSLNVVGEQALAKFKEFCDVADFVGVNGELVRTQTGELTVQVETFELLSKALRGLPEKFHGLVDIDTKYAGYLSRQNEQIERERKLEEKKIPEGLDFMKLEGLRLEAREKLAKIKPLTVGMASRISGVSPADITVLLLYLK